MKRKHTLQVLGLLVLGGLIGGVAGPTAVHAVQQMLVTIEDGTTGNKAKVTGGRLQVNTELEDINGSLPTLTRPLGQFFLHDVASSQPDFTFGESWVVTTIVVDAGTSGPVTVTITRTSDDGSSDIIWRGTAPAGGHLSDSFEGGLSLNAAGGNVFDVTIPPTTEGARVFFYGRAGQLQ